MLGCLVPGACFRVQRGGAEDSDYDSVGLLGITGGVGSCTVFRKYGVIV